METIVFCYILFWIVMIAVFGDEIYPKQVIFIWLSCLLVMFIGVFINMLIA